ncbi:MAG: nucleotidyltransferase domain-containing protein [Candidatus Methanofastidiosia archaeon]
MGVLILNSNREFHLREIARKIDITPTYVKKELKNLQKLNLIVTSKKGNLSLFQINRDSIIFDELKSIFIKIEYFGELLKKSLKELKIDFGFIFGSFAKGIENTESDIDLFVVGEVDENDLLTIIQEIERQTKREINYIVWKKADLMERAKKHHLLNEIAKNPVIMLVGDENEFRKIIE